MNISDLPPAHQRIANEVDRDWAHIIDGLERKLTQAKKNREQAIKQAIEIASHKTPKTTATVLHQAT